VGKVITNFSISLDGYIAGANENFDQLFKWYSSGDTEFVFDSGMAVKISRASADVMQETIARTGAGLMGRRLFDLTNGWDGKPPANAPVFVVTHNPPQGWQSQGNVPYTFVTDGVVSALEQAQQVAGDKDVVISSATIAQQCLQAELLDEIHLDLVPFVLGDGVPLFANMGATPIELEVLHVVSTPHVTHIAYRVVK
jgi:dihydrofolate reductase